MKDTIEKNFHFIVFLIIPLIPLMFEKNLVFANGTSCDNMVYFTLSYLYDLPGFDFHYMDDRLIPIGFRFFLNKLLPLSFSIYTSYFLLYFITLWAIFLTTSELGEKKNAFLCTAVCGICPLFAYSLSTFYPASMVTILTFFSFYSLLKSRNKNNLLLVVSGVLFWFAFSTQMRSILYIFFIPYYILRSSSFKPKTKAFIFFGIGVLIGFGLIGILGSVVFDRPFLTYLDQIEVIFWDESSNKGDLETRFSISASAVFFILGFLIPLLKKIKLKKVTIFDEIILLTSMIQLIYILGGGNFFVISDYIFSIFCFIILFFRDCFNKKKLNLSLTLVLTLAASFFSFGHNLNIQEKLYHEFSFAGLCIFVIIIVPIYILKIRNEIKIICLLIFLTSLRGDFNYGYELAKKERVKVYNKNFAKSLYIDIKKLRNLGMVSNPFFLLKDKTKNDSKINALANGLAGCGKNRIYNIDERQSWRKEILTQKTSFILIENGIIKKDIIKYLIKSGYKRFYEKVDEYTVFKIN